ncbi:MAG: NADH-quinone oxidoreductase subunit J [Dermatophilaceae bacterium]
MTGTGETVLFWTLGPLMVAASLGLLFARKAVHAALCMAFVMVNLGVFYIAQQAQFLGVVQVFVYTGAVMMLFLFVLMLIGVDAADSVVETIRGQRVASLVLAFALIAVLFVSVGSAVLPASVGLEATNADPGNVTSLAWLIFGKYVWVFEITSALLITAAIGAMVLAHRERLTPKVTQRELAQRRVRDNAFVAGLPAPGVYARHNAVDTPALLPDGRPSELSVSRVLVARDQITAPDTYTEAQLQAEREIQQGSAR